MRPRVLVPSPCRRRLCCRADGHAAPSGGDDRPSPCGRNRARPRQRRAVRAGGRRHADACCTPWLAHADARTTLLPDRLDADRSTWIYTPHNSGADLYPYLVLTAQLTDPDLYEGRMLEMLRNEIRFTSAQASVPGNLTFATGVLGPPSLFGAGEYAKDGLVSVTEYLGRTPWFYRMVDLTADAMAQAPVHDALREAARLGHRAQRRLPADAHPPRHDDGRQPLSRVGAPHRRRVRRGGPARQLRRAGHAVGLRRPHRRSPSCACAIMATRPWSA